MGEREVSGEEQQRFSDAMTRREARHTYLEVGGQAYAEEEEPSRAALLELSRLLRELAKAAARKSMATKARLAWALSLGSLRTLEEQCEALRFLEEVLNNIFHAGLGREAHPAREAAEKAQTELHALMDALRDRAPEHLR